MHVSIQSVFEFQSFGFDFRNIGFCDFGSENPVFLNFSDSEILSFSKTQKYQVFLQISEFS